jgi:hypothetical protein
MEHDVSLISTVAAAFGVAMVLGFLAERVKIPSLVGYLVAGILIGPATPGFVADAQIAAQLSEIGAVIAPPVPAFYAKPETLDDMVGNSVGRVLDLFDIDVGLVTRWGEAP